jgi:hypothetical protein
MREALMLQLEKLSYYQHLSLTGGKERPIYSCRVIDIRGSRYHVLSRIQDAGLDFTGRTNFLAHHLAFAPDEIRQFASPPAILRSWPDWVKSWSKEPHLLEKEDWSTLPALSAHVFVPATHWQQLTGDAVNGYSLLESRAGITFRADNLPEDQTLALFAEALELLELRDPRRDFHATAWQYTFTTSMQEQDNPADFRWRCLHLDNPASSRFAGPDCRPISDLRALRVTPEETMLARVGRQAPRFVLQPQNVRTTEGQLARLLSRADGVPSPSYQWFALDRAGNGQAVASGKEAELVVQTPPLGLSRYVVRASNSQGDVTSDVATLSVDPKARLAQIAVDREEPIVSKHVPSYTKSADQIERQRRQLEAKQAEAVFQKTLRRRKVLAICGAILACVAFAAALLPKWAKHKSSASPIGTSVSKPAPPHAAQGLTPATSSTAVVTQTQTPPRPQTGPATQPTSSGPVINKPATLLDWPPDWSHFAIGNVLNPHAEWISNRCDLSATALGFARQGDDVWFVCTTNRANTFQAKLLPVPQCAAGSACGIMVRQSDNPTAAFLFVGVNEDHVISWGRDMWTKFDYKDAHLSTSARTKPLFLRIQNTTNALVASYAFDPSQTWFHIGPTNGPLKAPTILSGLAVCSRNLSNTAAAKFDSIVYK